MDVWSVTETEKQIMQKFAELRQRLGVDGMCSEKNQITVVRSCGAEG